MLITKTVLVLAGLAALLGLAAARQSSLLEWQQFKQKHAKVYANKTEDAHRFTLFLAAKDKINMHNLAAGSSHKLGLNHMSDWTPAEFAKLNGFRYNKEHHERRLEASKDNEFLRNLLKNVSNMPAEVDWRKVPGRVSDVKDQAHCGSCWAFATTGLLEGQEYLKRQGQVPLSEQDLVECSKSNYGCDGGEMSLALKDIHSMGGIESEAEYPYIGPVVKDCRFTRTKVVFSDKGTVDLPARNETLLQATVAYYGPVAIAMDATDNLRSYESGILRDPLCMGDKLNHGVLVVGYGTDKIGGDYWLVKNSWGAEWGEEGYFRMARGVNMCGIGELSTIAFV